MTYRMDAASTHYVLPVPLLASVMRRLLQVRLGADAADAVGRVAPVARAAAGEAALAIVAAAAGGAAAVAQGERLAAAALPPRRVILARAFLPLCERVELLLAPAAALPRHCWAQSGQARVSA